MHDYSVRIVDVHVNCMWIPENYQIFISDMVNSVAKVPLCPVAYSNL